MSDVKHGVIRTDLMSGTDVAADLVSLKYFDADDKPAAIDNGCVVALSGLIDGERELWKAETPAANSDLSTIAIVATPEVMYDARQRNLSDFVNEAGKPARGYIPRSRNVFSVTAEALNTAEGFVVKVGNVVELMAGVKLNVVASATEGATAVGKIIAIEQAGRYTYYVIQLA